jgi:hypothetical protein
MLLVAMMAILMAVLLASEKVVMMAGNLAWK